MPQAISVCRTLPSAAPRCTAALHIMEREYTLYEQQVMEMVNRLCSAMQCGDTVDPLFEAVAARLGPHTADAAIAAGAKQAAVVARASPRPRGKRISRRSVQTRDRGFSKYIRNNAASRSETLGDVAAAPRRPRRGASARRVEAPRPVSEASRVASTSLALRDDASA